MPDITKLHFANFFNVFTDTSLMQNNELAFDSDYRLVFKDNVGVLHNIVSVDDYANLYAPLSVTVTQIVKTAKVGIGTEGDFSAKVTKSMPLSNIATATGIHNRLMLVHYDNLNNLKDTVLFPEYFCKLGTYADVLDINKGVMTEYIKKIEIKAHQGKTTLTNNNIFKIYLTETTDVATTLNYPLTVEANKDNIANRDQMYIGADNYLYIIKANSVSDLTYPLWFFNRRTSSVKVKVNTTIPLLEKDDNFVFESYRYFSDNITGTTYQFIGGSETAQITKVLTAVKTTSLGKEYVTLGISGDKKSVTGIEDGAHYTITVITDEAPVIPSMQYKFLDVQEGFFGYLYSILKDINDNEQQVPIDIDALAETVRLSVIEYLDAQLALKADLASPALTGVPTAPTAAINTNTIQLASTAFVLNQAGTATPLMAGVAAVGIATRFAREDHKHPIDTSRAPLASPALTGTPTTPTAAINTNTTQIASTAFVLSQAGTATPLMAGVAAVGIATKFAREDHKHPIDTSRAPVDSPIFTTLVKTPDIDMQGNDLWNVSNIPVINILPDSGRFMGNQQDPYSLTSSASFVNSNFFVPYNGGNAFSSGKFINNNNDNGGVAGNMSADMVTLVNTMNTIAGKDKRYGAEFHMLDITQGSGTATPHGTNTTHYLLTVNNSKSISGSGDYFTVSYWIRLKTGTGATINKGNKLHKNGVEVGGAFLALSTSDGWMHIQAIYKASAGYVNAMPEIYVPTGAVIQIALPVIVPGGTGVGIHTSPIPRVDFGYTSASTDSPTFTGTVVLPTTTSIGSVSSTEIGYLDGVTSGIQTQLNLKAPLASPALTGTPTAPTAATDTNNGQLATTAFVIGQITAATVPLMDGIAASGTSLKAARADHIHPIDTSRAPLASPSFTGTANAQTFTVKNPTDGGYFFKSIGRFTTSATTANQKIDLYYTGNFYGYLEITVSGGWNGVNNVGNVTKAFALVHQVSTTIDNQSSKYIEVIGNIGTQIAISDLTWDATNSRWKIQIVYLNGSNAFTESFTVSIKGHSAGTAFITNILAAQLGSVYTTDATAFSAPKINYINAIETNSQIVSTLATGTSPFSITSTTVNTNLNADMVDGFHLNQDVRSTASPTLVRLTLSQATGTAPMTITSTTLVTNLNADMVDGFHLDQDVRIAASPTHVRLTLSQATGTAPMTVTSTTLVTNLNADMVDGFHLNQDVRTTASPTFAGLTLNIGEGLVFLADENYFGANLDARVIRLTDANDASGIVDGGLVIEAYGPTGGTPSRTELIRIRNTEFKYLGNTIWHAGNDGAGSTADADLLDGMDSSTSDTISTIAARDINGDLYARAFRSTVATGTAPFVVTSTTVVANLNADMVDGYGASIANTNSLIPVRDGAGNINVSRVTASVATGTSPFVITSTTLNTNLNADMVDGFHLDQDVRIAASPTHVRLILSQATGTAPMTITSTTLVTNLNADMVDGFHLDQDVRSTASPTHVRLILSQATGTAPMTVTSTTLVTNLNADTVDGFHLNQDVRSTASPTFVNLTTTGTIASTGAITSTSNITASGYIKAAGNKASLVFTAGQITKTITHNFGTTSYMVTWGADSTARHIKWANKLSNTVDILLDSAHDSTINVDVILLP